MNEEYKTHVDMNGNLVETKAENAPSVALKDLNKRTVILSMVFFLCYIFFIIYNSSDIELVPIFLGVILFYFAFELFPYIDKNKYLILVGIYGIIGVFECFRLVIFILTSVFGLSFFPNVL